MSGLEQELSSVLNRYSQENASNTPDFVLAQYLLGCLAAFNTAVQQRETWYGRDARPGSCSTQTDAAARNEVLSALTLWVEQRWDAEVKNRPMQNVHRRTLDGTWKQMLAKLNEMRASPIREDESP